ncbi:phosphate signaling complex protein PhoU [Mycolicibacterium brisbanense]|uniref:Phosphate-specific transport system accessory protein PhoU n=1 Tax=Mycolicibacterium brisbanense TaxID=146020 RepID=A0A100W0P9_9MYCO|nr:phosphate signaling complex protein PhoU [Mycolicibacterium brisbanense]MCV7155890.1 phosphate signaling complex protein PhoU [Mycolicibacterium brisbanense]GAS89502.1 PhoY2 protein [Mycolicibacterium brisbanense]
MRNVFHAQLDALSGGIADLCDRTGSAMNDATCALLQADVHAAEEVIEWHHDITYLSGLLEGDALTILARQAPVAGDLRAVVSALKDLADVRRMGALATHIARIGRLRHPAKAVPDEVEAYVAEMGRIAVQIAGDAKSVVLSRDPERAAQLGVDDEAMDELHRQLFSRVLSPTWAHGTVTAVDVTLLSRYFERFADHAVDIANRVIYQATGARQRE